MVMTMTTETKRTRYLTVCFSPAELDALEKRAKAEGIVKSAWARRAVVMALKAAAEGEAKNETSHAD